MAMLRRPYQPKLAGGGAVLINDQQGVVHPDPLHQSPKVLGVLVLSHEPDRPHFGVQSRQHRGHIGGAA